MKKVTHIITFLLLFLAMAITSGAQGFDYLENAVYTYNFVRYTSWPQKKAVIQIGIVGTTPLEAELKKLLARKKNSSTEYVVKNIQPAEARGVDVVIVARSSADKLKAVCDHTAKAPILIISEKENMDRTGACISFFLDEDNDFKTGYQLSVKNCKTRGLLVNDQIIDNAALIK